MRLLPESNAYWPAQCVAVGADSLLITSVATLGRQEECAAMWTWEREWNHATRGGSAARTPGCQRSLARLCASRRRDPRQVCDGCGRHGVLPRRLELSDGGERADGAAPITGDRRHVPRAKAGVHAGRDVDRDLRADAIAPESAHRDQRAHFPHNASVTVMSATAGSPSMSRNALTTAAHCCRHGSSEREAQPLTL